MLNQGFVEFFVDEIRFEKEEAKAPYAALLGDIGNPKKPLYEKFIEEQVGLIL